MSYLRHDDKQSPSFQMTYDRKSILIPGGLHRALYVTSASEYCGSKYFFHYVVKKAHRTTNANPQWCNNGLIKRSIVTSKGWNQFFFCVVVKIEQAIDATASSIEN